MATMFASLKSFSGGRLFTHLQNPLFRNGYALLLSSGLSSGLGFFFWAIAARLYTTEQFGLNSATVSAIIFLSGISQLSLQGMLIRYIPIAGQATRKLIIYTYLTVFVGGTLAGIVGLLVWAPAFGFVTATPLVAIWFVASVSVLSIFSMQDAILAGLRQTVWVPLENATYSIIKLVLLVVLATALPQHGIFVSWTICLLLLIPPINYLIFRRLVPRHTEATKHRAEPISIRQITRYIAGNYIASILNTIASALLPVIMVQVAGAESNAHFYPNWTILASLQLVAFNMATSLTVEASIEKEKLLHYSYRIFLQVMRLLVPVVLVIVVFAPFILQIYGKAYSDEGTTLLRLLALSAIPNVFTVIFISMARVRHWMKGLIAVNGAIVILGLGSSYLLLQVYGITGVGIGWLITQIAVALCIGVILVYPRLRKLVSSESGRLNPMASQTRAEAIPDHIRQHYEVEKRLANRLRQAASRPERLKLYGEVYDELYREFSYLKEHREKTTLWQVNLVRRFVKPTDTFLEVGAGNCEVSIGVAALVRQAYAVDVSQVFMKKEGWPPNLQFVLSDGSSIPVEAASIDLVYSHQVMEHLHADDGLDQLNHIYKSLKKNGRYICITPNRLCGPHDISRYFDEVATGFHLKEYTLAELNELLRQVGFSKVQAFVSYHGLMLSPILPIQPFLWVERVLERLPYAWRKKAWWLLIPVKLIATK